jgi:hypothetical protein
VVIRQHANAHGKKTSLNFALRCHPEQAQLVEVAVADAHSSEPIGIKAPQASLGAWFNLSWRYQREALI